MTRTFRICGTVTRVLTDGGDGPVTAFDLRLSRRMRIIQVPSWLPDSACLICVGARLEVAGYRVGATSYGATWVSAKARPMTFSFNWLVSFAATVTRFAPRALS